MSKSDFISVIRRSPKAGGREIIGVGLIYLCVVCLYGYVGLPPIYRAGFERESSTYYNQLVAGFLAGRLGFKVDPPPALVGLADPYDPVQRAQADNVGLHDASYYKGRYYLYFGVAPALVLFLPFKILTGFYFPEGLATVLFCCGGYFCSLGTFLLLRRRYFPGCTTTMVWIGALLLGLGNFCTPLLARNSIWEVPISSAYFFSSLGFWCLLLGLGEAGRRRGWLLVASLAFGLVVASRPHLVFGPIALGGFWLAHWWIRVRRGAGPKLAVVGREFVEYFLPLALVLAALLTYNYLRFEDPFQFGQKYVLAGNKQLNTKLVGWEYLPINFYFNFLAPAQIERYFPFFQVIRGYPGVRPAAYGGAEDPYGVLVNMPFSWLALLAPILWYRYFRVRREVGAWLAILGLFFLAVAMATMCFSWAANRYEVDFIPPLVLLAALGLLMVGDWDGQGRRLWFILRIGATAAVVYTAAFNVLVAIQHNGLFKVYRPETFVALARICNQPVLWWETRHPPSYGPLELTVRFPTDRAGQAQPLLVTGVSYRSDYLYVYYFPDGKHVQLGYTRTNNEHLLSQPIALDYNVPHRLGIKSGALYPPDWHPYFSRKTAVEISSAKRTFYVTLDGVPYFNSEQEFFDTTPGFITVGENHVSNYISSKFTGEVLGAQRQPLPPSISEFKGGSFLRLALVLPKSTASQREPLVVTGETRRDDCLFLAGWDKNGIVLGFEHAGQPPLLSHIIPVQPDAIQLLDVSLGSFYSQPKNARERELAQHLIVQLNGQTVWSLPQAFHPMGARLPAIGRDRLGESDASSFSGTIVAEQAVQLLPAAADSPFSFSTYWLTAEARPDYGAIRLTVELPRSFQTGPLLVTAGPGGQADYVLLGSVREGQASFTYVHTNSAPLLSHRAQFDAKKPQVIEIDVPSLYPSESDEFFATRSMAQIAALKSDRARLKFNGETLLDSRVQFFGSRLAQMTLGEDRNTGVFGKKFAGRILGVERASFASPAGFDTGFGPLEMEMSFPADRSEREEVLLATGDATEKDVLAVKYDTADQAHFMFKGAHGINLAGPAIQIGSGGRHKLQVNWGGFYPPSAQPKTVPTPQWQTWQRRLRVSLDGREVLVGNAEFLLASPELVIFGREAGGVDGFTGRIDALRRLPAPGP